MAAREHRGLVACGPVAAIAVVVALTALGCGSDSEPTRAELQLIAKVDAICANSEDALRAERQKFPDGDAPDFAYSPGLAAYADALPEISGPVAERLAALQAPASIRALYQKYVKAQQEVYFNDLTAAHAVHAAHHEEYLEARERTNEEQRERYELAREIGLKTCSPSPE